MKYEEALDVSDAEIEKEILAYEQQLAEEAALKERRERGQRRWEAIHERLYGEGKVKHYLPAKLRT